VQIFNLNSSCYRIGGDIPIKDSHSFYVYTFMI
jgi:hypothetical protein